MIPFHSVTISDRPWIRSIIKKENSRSADYSFGTMFCWSKRYPKKVSPFQDRLLMELNYAEIPSYLFPAGGGPLRPAVEELIREADGHRIPLLLFGVTEEQKAQLESEFPGEFTYEADRTYSEYVYEAERLATYAGKALHSKKNHCNRFEAENEWQFVPLTDELVPLCLEMLDRWHEENTDRLDAGVSNELCALRTAMQYRKELEMEGGVLLVNGKVVGFTMGERANSDTFIVHFEKAQADMNGAYPMVCREFTRMIRAKYPDIVYINREDDMGLEALRKSKLSYKPVFMVQKYLARRERTE